jgi:hypothetical protein
MWGMVRFEVEMLASVGGFSVIFSGRCRPFPDDQNLMVEVSPDLHDNCVPKSDSISQNYC